jgi:hypothetical protein
MRIAAAPAERTWAIMQGRCRSELRHAPSEGTPRMIRQARDGSALRAATDILATSWSLFPVQA